MPKHTDPDKTEFGWKKKERKLVDSRTEFVMEQAAPCCDVRDRNSDVMDSDHTQH